MKKTNEELLREAYLLTHRIDIRNKAEKLAQIYVKKEVKRSKSLGDNLDDLTQTLIEIAFLDGVAVGMEEEAKLQKKIFDKLQK